MNGRLLFSSILIFLLLAGIYWGMTYTPWKNGGDEISTNALLKDQLTCVSKPLNLSSFLGEQWINYTSKRLKLAECPKGGFTEIVDTITPDLISTYYFVSALKLLNETPSNRVQTVKWLHNNEGTLFANTTSAYNQIPRFWIVYYGVMTLEMLNSSPEDPGRIVDFILSTEQSNGSFVYEGMDFTPQAVELLHVLGYDLSNLQKTQKYCIGEFKNLTPTGEYSGRSFMDFLSEFPEYIKCLKLLRVNYTEMPEYKRDVLFIQNISKNVEKILEGRPPLFIVAGTTQLLREYGLLNKTISQELYDYVISQELPDGGFNLFGKDYGEFQGTYYAVETIVLTGKWSDDRTLNFIRSWESPLGGFAFTFQKTCGPVLTHMGVYVAEKIGMPLNKTQMKEYLKWALHNRWPYTQDDPTALYAIYLTYRDLNLTMDLSDREYLKNETIRLMNIYLAQKRSALLSDTGWISLIELGNSIGVRLDSTTRSELIRKILSERNKNGTFGVGNGTGVILFQTTNAVILLHALGYNYNDTTTARYLLDEMHDGGWGGPDLFNTYAAMLAFESMGRCPKDVQGMINFIQSLKYKYGGFLFYRGAEYYGGLQETYYAFRILEIIGAIR